MEQQEKALKERLGRRVAELEKKLEEQDGSVDTAAEVNINKTIDYSCLLQFPIILEMTIHLNLPSHKVKIIQLTVTKPSHHGSIIDFIMLAEVFFFIARQLI